MLGFRSLTVRSSSMMRTFVRRVRGESPAERDPQPRPVKEVSRRARRDGIDQQAHGEGREMRGRDLEDRRGGITKGTGCYVPDRQ